MKKEIISIVQKSNNIMVKEALKKNIKRNVFDILRNSPTKSRNISKNIKEKKGERHE